MSFKHLSFVDLFEQEGLCVEIPMLQRDYAYGRVTETEKRKEFLKNIRKYLLSDNSNHELDFVYGSEQELNRKKTLTLLDGQQRITTLFLMHWYFALAAGEESFARFKSILWDGSHSKFSYNTRFSASDFCDSLLKLSNRSFDAENQVIENDRVKVFIDLIKSNTKKGFLSSAIRNEKWYFLHWNNDPTIFNMLNMLDSIAEEFPYETAKTFFEKLDKKGENASITFNFLNLDDYKLTNDLYIKMNSRGRPLTRFENLKSKILKELDLRKDQDAYKNVLREINAISGKEYNSLREYVGLMFDTKWTDLFWNLNQQSDLDGNPPVDDMILSFICNYCVCFGALQCMQGQMSVTKNGDERKLIDGLMDQKNSIEYETLIEILCHQDASCLYNLIKIFDSLCEKQNSEITLKKYFSPSFYIFDELKSFQSIARDYCTEGKNYDTKVLYFGYMLYISRSPYNGVNKAHFEDWMRFVHNIVMNSYTLSNAGHTFCNSLAGINYLFDLDIETALPQKDMSNIYTLDRFQLDEEILKAKLSKNILWKQSLIDASTNLKYFEGHLHYVLIDYSKVLESDVQNTAAIDRFNANVAKMASIFNSNGCLYEPELICALLSKGDYTPFFNSSNSLLQNSGRDTSWRRYLKMSQENEGADDKRKFFTDVICDIDFDERNPKDSLKKIAAKYPQTIDNWRKNIIDYPIAIDYLGADRYIRWNEKSGRTHSKVTRDDYEIDLLKKKQIFGKHAELFTYCLFNQMKSKTLKISLDYEYTKLEDDQPFMKCSFISTQNPSSKIESKIFYEDKSKYTILIYVQNKPIVERTLSQKGFSIQGDYYEKKCVSDAIIEQELIGLQNTLEPIL